MTGADHIEALKQMPPRVPRTRWQLIAEIVGWICAVIAVVALVVGSYGAMQARDAASQGRLAARQAKSVADCVNNILGTRGAPQAADNAAHIAFAESIQDLFRNPKHPTPAQARQETASFKAAVDSYVQTLLTDQRERDAKPLGRC